VNRTFRVVFRRDVDEQNLDQPAINIE